ncbi:MAG TPA: DUF4419 domain-containing protein [Planctomycetota bacterium]|nr:DUF4419 domain-containing protein [Planctomycetota bacterium]
MEALTKLINAPVEQMWTSDAKLVSCADVHPLVQAAHDAFYEHRPLVLSPDSVWFCLAQGFAHHVSLDPERLRRRFVAHDGKITLLVARPDFSLGQSNPWPEMFAEFSDQLATHVGKFRDLVVADFTTTGALERAASEVVLMDTFQGYFQYKARIGCGIPSVTLLGTPADWRSIRERAARFCEFELDAWTRVLLPVLDQIVLAAEGHDDREFWQSFFHDTNGSGMGALTGWIHVLFPYLKDSRTGAHTPNSHLPEWERTYAASSAPGRQDRPRGGPFLSEIPSGLSSVPVQVIDAQTMIEHRMRFVAGMFGVIEDTSGALAPEFGWAVIHDRADEPIATHLSPRG